MSNPGINNWREAMWVTIILGWIVVIVASLIGVVDVDSQTVIDGAKLIIVGMMAHIVWLHYVRSGNGVVQ